MGTIEIDGSTPKLTIGNATAEDATILFDGNAQDFYIALDDSADDLLIGLGSTVGTTPAISIDENLAIKTYGDITMTGTTPTLTIGDAGAEDTAIVFDGNAQDFYIALDDSADDLLIGLGSTIGTTPAISIDENLAVKTYGDVTMTGTTPTLTIGDAGTEDAKIVFDGNAQDFHIGLDDSADDLVIGLGSALGTTSHIVIDEAGHINMPLQSLVIARNEATISNVTGDGTAYTHVFATEVADQNGDFASPTFTAPVAGKYLVTVGIHPEDISSATYVVAYINASNRNWYFLSSGDGVKNNGNDFRIAGAALIDMDASDTASITVQISGVGGDTVDFVAGEWFTIQLMA